VYFWTHNNSFSFFREKSYCRYSHAPTSSLMFESPLSRRVEENRPRRVSGAVNIVVLSLDGGMNTIPYPTEVYRGVSYPWGRIQGCKWREGGTRLLLLRGVTSRLISFHFLSFHSRASAGSAKCMCVCVWAARTASYSLPGDVANRAEKRCLRAYIHTSSVLVMAWVVFQCGSAYLNTSKIYWHYWIKLKILLRVQYLKMCVILNVM